MDNFAVEIHDSTLERLERDGDAIVAVFSAYVHRSDGKPGVDAGTGWEQTLRLRVGQARVSGNSDMLPMYLLAGHVEVSGERFHNIFPVPLKGTGAIKLELRGRNDASIVIEGEGFEAALTGKAVYIEEFFSLRD